MTPRLAFRLTIALALIGAGALVPLFGLFGMPLRPGTWAPIVAILAIIAAFVFASEVGVAPVQSGRVSRLLNIVTQIMALYVLAGLIAQSAFAESAVAAWFDRMDVVLLTVVLKLPPELVLLLPAFAVIVALGSGSGGTRFPWQPKG